MTVTAGLQQALHGVGIDPVTPFSAEVTRVDVTRLRAKLEHVLERGVGILYSCDSTGEFAPLLLEERKAVVEMTVEFVARPNPASVNPKRS